MLVMLAHHLSLLQMGKAPKKRSLADKVRKTKTSNEIKNNPFEVKINRKKFDILGRKSKHDVGLPGVSRSKAITKVREHLELLLPSFTCNASIVLHSNTKILEIANL